MATTTFPEVLRPVRKVQRGMAGLEHFVLRAGGIPYNIPR